MSPSGIPMAELGYVGLGVMGGGVAKRLLDAGHTVTGWNRTKERASWLLDAGMRWGESPRDVAVRSEIVFTMVTNTAAVQAVTEGRDGIIAGLRPGAVYVDMMQKDMNLALELGRELDVPLPTTAVTNELLTAARAMGLAEQDFAAIFDVLAQLSGVAAGVVT